MIQQIWTSSVQPHKSFKDDPLKTEGDDSTACSGERKHKTDKVGKPYPRANILPIPLLWRSAQKDRATENTEILRHQATVGENPVLPLSQRHRSSVAIKFVLQSVMAVVIERLDCPHGHREAVPLPRHVKNLARYVCPAQACVEHAPKKGVGQGPRLPKQGR